MPEMPENMEQVRANRSGNEAFWKSTR
ncbi:hypothetical protein MDA_GLEAN10025756 [Myotis davidii]|uniref:Uncharacterized protein n=1 Tax=Myotis davidii TaxID=225400 RepID=L5LQV0_MYODS|nr:hypothetical protein MDA_GLEAN10025756 [Myotis davidii]